MIVLIIGSFEPIQKIDDGMVSYVIDPGRQDVEFYWKDDRGEKIRSIQRLKDCLAGKHKRLVFAMNGGMFKADHTPVGIYIQQGRTIVPLDTSSGQGNFYLKPNGVFYITSDDKAGICGTEDFPGKRQIKFATQSGPLLVIDGLVHPAFREGSTNVNIRNGVGILPDGRLLFAMSKGPINFFDFAMYFKDRGCKYALYLDGFVSRTYLPEKHWEQLDGDLGVIIGVCSWNTY